VKTIRPFLDPLGNGYGFRWTLEFVEPGTGSRVAGPYHGDGSTTSGSGAVDATLPKAGAVQARLKVVSDEGMTFHHAQEVRIQ